MKNYTNFDVIIVGAGPAEIVCAMQLAKKGFQIALFEKETFPRDKTCGDALSVDVLNQLELIDPLLANEFKNFTHKTPSYGVKIIAPNQQSLDIPFYYKGQKRFGYICKRIDFDNFLFQKLQAYKNIVVFENCKVNAIVISLNEAVVTTKNKTYTSKIIIGADGTQSIVNKLLIKNKIDKEHYSAGLRVYYKNVSNLHKDNFIELHFFKDILPGYLWIFPLPNNEANIGIGMLSSYVSKKKINLRIVLKKLLENHPNLKDRFNHAEALETSKGFGLPLGSKKRKLSSNRVLLLGDAAGLIDPFSGEGIGNAVRSGRVAAKHIETCFELQNFTKLHNSKYDKGIYRLMEKEFRISRTLQNLCKYPRLFNFIINKATKNKATKNKAFHKFLIGSLENIDKKNMLTKPSFYYRLFFKN